jgi:hypothetical protein
MKLILRKCFTSYSISIILLFHHLALVMLCAQYLHGTEWFQSTPLSHLLFQSQAQCFPVASLGTFE